MHRRVARYAGCARRRRERAPWGAPGRAERLSGGEAEDDALGENAFDLRDVVEARGSEPVLRGVTLGIPGGAITALVGPSGAGKTSLLRLLNRLDDATTGEVLFRGERIETYPVRELRCRVGFVFQTPVMFAGTVAANLEVAAELSPRGRPAGDGWIAELLEQVELGAGYAGREADRLSGGEKQRVALARALATGPEVLLLDEPTSALDPEVAERLLATVRRINAERGHTVVMVTHRLAEARQVSTYTAMLEAGRVVEAGPTVELFERPRQARTRAYLAGA